MYISNKMQHFSYKGERGVCVICASMHLKEQLAWGIDKQLQVINAI